MWDSTMWVDHTMNTHIKEVLQCNKLEIHTKHNSPNIISNHKNLLQNYSTPQICQVDRHHHRQHDQQIQTGMLPVMQHHQ
jgi:hypothetical protein